MPNIGLTQTEIEKAMLNDPETWAEMYLFQEEMIDELQELLDEYQIRLDLLLRDPDELDH